MKVLISLMAILSLCSFLLANCAPVNTGQKAPDFISSTIYGENFALKDHVGQQGGNKVLILVLFNTRCKASEEDLRYLQRVYDKYKKDGLDVVYIFTDRSGNRDHAKNSYRISI